MVVDSAFRWATHTVQHSFQHPGRSCWRLLFFIMCKLYGFI